MPGLRESLEKLKKTAWRGLAEVYEQGATGFYVMGRDARMWVEWGEDAVEKRRGKVFDLDCCLL